MKFFRYSLLFFCIFVFPIASPHADIELFGDNPILAAIKSNDLEGVKVAIARGEKVEVEDFDGRNSIIYADIIEFLAAQRISITHRDKLGNSALYYAADQGHIDAIVVLIEKGAAINSENRRGITPLMIAASQGRVDIVRVLLKYGVDVSKRDYTGRTALMWAEWNRRNFIIKLLREAGAKE